MVGHFLGRKAFCLVELGAVLMVVATVSLVLYPLGDRLIKNAYREKQMRDLKAVGVACRQYYASHGRWPMDALELYPRFLAIGSDLAEYVLFSKPSLMKIVRSDHSLTIIKPQQ